YIHAENATHPSSYSGFQMRRPAFWGVLLHYINPAHAISLLSALNEERMKGQLCDVILIVGDQKFRAHKNVLAASSEYFHSLFTDKSNESQNVFQLDFCEADAFDNVLNYIYSSSLFVEKGSLAAVQELGYSLGITFLTNILSKTPRHPFPNVRQRSVIVCQSKNEPQGSDIGHKQHDKGHPSRSSSTHGKTGAGKQHARSSDTLNSLFPERNWRGSLSTPSDQSGWLKRNIHLQQKTLSEDSEEDQPTSSGLLGRGSMADTSKKRVTMGLSSICSMETPYSLQKAGKEGLQKKDERNLLYYSKLGLAVPPAGSASQSIDRSGPLVKSLLRRSLSMDSQVPTYSEGLDSKALPGMKMVKDSLKDDVPNTSQRISIKTEDVAQDECTKPYRISRSSSMDTAFDKELQIKTEPRSPASEPSEIIRVTVGDASQAKNRDVRVKSEEGSDPERPQSKRKLQVDRRTLPSRRVKMKPSSPPECNANFGEASARLNEDFSDSDDSKGMSIDMPEIRQNRKFKCKHCLKIFRSTAGLHRHVNMYHNPEKPYACDICNKRFHTNFKVWTHCQTQHGIVRNPSPSSSAHSVLDDKFQRKLIDIVREREVKKALIFKLRRTKSGYQGSSSSQAQALKRSLRSRNKASFICNYCGKSYRFLSQFKQHCKMHPVDKMYGNRGVRPKEPPPPKNPMEIKDMFSCRLCNTKLSSFLEQGSHERMCRNATLCPYCSLRFSSPELKNEHEMKCEYKKLTCLECMRTFKSSFSIWRHQVEVHNQNTMAPTENLSLPLIDHNGENVGSERRLALPDSRKVSSYLASKEDGVYSDSSEHMNFDSEDSNCLPEDLSVSKRFSVQIKEEPVDDMENDSSYRHKEVMSDSEGGGVWTCEKCGKIFTVHKHLERHQELLCSVKPFICHVCNKAFRTNFRLWSHFQSHMSHAEGHSFKEPEVAAPASSPSPPPIPPPPPPLPKIQPIEPENSTPFPEKRNTKEKLFVPQESESLFYHAPPLSALTFKRQFMCKLCHRTFKTAFSLWSHEQTHN
uniref:Zinc finger and BTB domain containing 21 n=1 Tax=Leptobrachium leishanense TaxID=445787 RepID=A0A8C5LS09_9ANUR